MEQDKPIITKEVAHKYLISLLDSAGSEPEKVTAVIFDFYLYLTKNYDSLEPDLQKDADKMFNDLTEQVGVVLNKQPDTPEMRQMRRLHKSVEKNLPTAKTLMMTLEAPSSLKDEIVVETREFFEKYCQASMDFLFEIMEEQFKGSTPFACVSLLLSCIDELVCALQMAQHAYVNQSYSHIRTVFESLNLVYLFIKEPAYAELWCSDKKEDRKRKKEELKPVNVRQKLGIDKDPLYAFLSAHGTHVSFEYVQAKSFKKADVEKNTPTISFCLAGTRSLRHIYMANLGCVLALGQVLLCVGKAFRKRVHDEDYPLAVINYAIDFRKYILGFLNVFKEAGADVSEVEAELATVLQFIDDTVTTFRNG